jgi:hypothetical protein
MVIGTATIAIWLLTFAHGLEVAGAFTLMIGLFLTAFGAIALLTYFITSLSAGAKLWRTILISAICGSLMLANFPLMMLYIWIAECFHVRVINTMNVPLTSVVIIDPDGRQISLGPVTAHGDTSRWFHPTGEGEITLSARWTGGNATAEVTGYTTSSQTGEQKIVTITGNGAASVR